MVSIIVPVFNEEKTVRELHQRIVATMAGWNDDYEIIFVNDGSTDNTYQEIKKLTPLRIVSLQRNYGETPALDVGIQTARGDIVVFLDADLQNDPADILILLQEIEAGYDVAIGWRQKRQDHWSRVIFSYFANKVSGSVLGLKIHDFGCGLKAYRSSFIKDFRLFGNSQVFLPAIAKARGARIHEVAITHYPRESGSSKMSLSHMVKTGFDLLSITFFVRYFFKPLRFFGGWGCIAVLLALLAFITAIALRLFGIENLTDTPLPTVGTLFAILGVMLFMMGLLAEMQLRVFYSTTNRSPYVIKKIENN